MSKGSWTRPKSKDVPEKKVADEWARLFGKKNNQPTQKGAKEVKEFRYGNPPTPFQHIKNDNVELRTLTVGELSSKLTEYPADMPVIPTWEGVHRGIQDDSFDIQEITHFNKDDNCKALVIDVEWET